MLFQTQTSKMNKFKIPKTLAWVLMLLTLTDIIISVRNHIPAWRFIDVFFFFMMSFSALFSAYMQKRNPYAAKKMAVMAVVFCAIGFIALIAELIIK